MEGKMFFIVLVTPLILLINGVASSSSVAAAEESVTEMGAEQVTTTAGTTTTLHHGRSYLGHGGENEVDWNKLSEGKRHPKFGFTVPFPNIPGIGGDFSTTPGPNQDGTQGGGGANGDLTSSASIGTTAVLIKGGILSGLLALKAAILPPIFLGALILFLIAGAGFFTCSVVNCGRFFGDIAVGGPGGFGSGSSALGGFPASFNPFNRNGNGIEEYEHQLQHQRPVFQALDDSYKKFN